MTISRRKALKALATGVGSAGLWPYLSDSAAEAFANLQAANAPAQLAFLSPSQYATVDAVAETIIPADDQSPGARAARVADYIDLLLSESDETTKAEWVEGLTAFEEESRRRFNAPYAQLSPAQATALLTDIVEERARPQNDAGAVLQAHQGRDHPRLLHVGNRHPQGTAIQRATSTSRSSSAAPIPSMGTSRAELRTKNEAKNGTERGTRNGTKNMAQASDSNAVHVQQMELSRRQAAAITPNSGKWDVIVVGSGAAGGMAAFQLATAGHQGAASRSRPV